MRCRGVFTISIKEQGWGCTVACICSGFYMFIESTKLLVHVHAHLCCSSVCYSSTKKWSDKIFCLFYQADRFPESAKETLELLLGASAVVQEVNFTNWAGDIGVPDVLKVIPATVKDIKNTVRQYPLSTMLSLCGNSDRLWIFNMRLIIVRVSSRFASSRVSQNSLFWPSLTSRNLVLSTLYATRKVMSRCT